MGWRGKTAAAVIAAALATAPGCESLGGPVATGAILGGCIGGLLGAGVSRGSDGDFIEFEAGPSIVAGAVVGAGIGALFGSLFAIVEEQDAGKEYAGPDPNGWVPPPMASGRPAE